MTAIQSSIFDGLLNIFKGDFGYSQTSGAQISSLIAARLPATLELVALSLVFSTLFGIIFGYISAIRHNRPIDYTLTAVGMFGISVPEFFFGLILIFVFGISLKWLPTGGACIHGSYRVLSTHRPSYYAGSLFGNRAYS